MAMSTLPADGVIAGQRPLFDAPADCTSVIRAYLGPQMCALTEAGITAIARKAVPWTIVQAEFLTETEEVRVLFGALIGADADCIAIMPSASNGLELAARTLVLECGQSVPVQNAIGQHE